MHRIELKQMSVNFRISYRVVEQHDLAWHAAFHKGAQHKFADPAKAVDCDPCHVSGSQ